MLTITIPANELYDEKNNRFIPVKEQKLQLEHSLISLSKWESKWHKPFFTKKDKTFEEIIDYIKCMTLTQNVNPFVYQCITKKNIEEISEYINDSMTATTFSGKDKGKINNEQITSELIYYWMVALQIPFECQKWHINRLITLIRVCNVKNTPPKKRSKGDVARSYSAINAARRKQLNTKG